MSTSVYLPSGAEIVARRQEARDIFTLDLKFCDEEKHQGFQFIPGQFNMLYLFGVGEIAISIVSDPKDINAYGHTIRRVGRVTEALSKLKLGEQIGIRGPFGRGWPLKESLGKDVLIITGGLGCAPSVSMINYIVNRRDDFGHLTILQGVKHSADLLFRDQYDYWNSLLNTEVHLAADISKPNWPFYTGLITELIDNINIDTNNTVCMMCGPEPMLLAAVKRLKQIKLDENSIYLNLERNMECAVGHCGHCQFGGSFVCKDGPVFCYADIKQLLGKRGF